MTLRTRSKAAILSLCVMPLVGCGINFTARGPIATAAAHLSGKIIGGQNPISGSMVTVWQVGANGYGSPATALAQTTSAADGSFDIPAGSYACVSAAPPVPAQVYITAAGGFAVAGYNNPNIMLAAGLGNCSTADDQTVNINEVTTAATAFALANFFTYNLGPGITDDFGATTTQMPALALSNAHTLPTLVNLRSGTVNPSTTAITIESAKIYSIANSLAACVNSTSSSAACTTLFTDTADPYSTVAPGDTLQAAVEMALFPYQNVSDIYQLSVPQAPFAGLSTAPNDWTVGVSYTTASMGLGIAGTSTSATSSTIDIDANGRIWVPSNLPGSKGVGYFDPALNTFTGPITASGVTLVQPQYVAIDTLGNVWLTDVLAPNLVVVDSTGITAPTSVPLTGPTALGPISLDFVGDAYFSYTGSAGAAKLGYIDGIAGTFSTLGSYTYNPTGLAWKETQQGDGISASESGSGTPCIAETLNDQGGGVYTSTIDAQSSGTCISGGAAISFNIGDNLAVLSSLNQVYEFVEGIFTPAVSLNLPEGIATDGFAETWVANSGNASISTFDVNGTGETSTVPYLHDASNGNTMTAPYGIAIDNSGNVWVSNASCVTRSATLCTPGAFVLSELIGAAGPTITPLSAQDGGGFAGLTPAERVSEAKGLARRSGGALGRGAAARR